MEVLTIQPVVNSLLECSICLEVYQDPRLLSCGHTFCIQYLQQYADKREDQSLPLMCSLCGTSWLIPEKGLGDLPKNCIAQDFISSLPSIIQCGEVDDDDNSYHGKIEYFCVNCWEPLCNNCYSLHRKLKLTRSHTIQKMSEVNHDDVSHHKKQMMFKCAAHKNQDITLFCTSCKALACSTCFAVLHTKHDSIEFDKADETFIAQITSSLRSLKNHCEEYNNYLQAAKNYMQKFNNQNEQAEREIKHLVTELKTNVKLAFEKLIANIDKHEEEILKENLKRNKATENELECNKQVIENMLAAAQNDILAKENLLNPMSTAMDRFKHIRDNLYQNGIKPNWKTRMERPKVEQLEINVTVWKSEFMEWSNNLLKLFNSQFYIPPQGEGCNNKRKVLVTTSNKNAIQMPTLTNQNLGKFNISFCDKKILIGEVDSTELSVYNYDGSHIKDIKIPDKLLLAAWTSQGNICAVTRDCFGYIIYLKTLSGEVLSKYVLRVRNDKSLNFHFTCDHLSYCEQMDWHISVDFGQSWKSKKAFYKRPKYQVYKVIRVVGDRSELFWTIEDDNNMFHLYYSHPLENVLKEHELAKVSYGCYASRFFKQNALSFDMVYDGKTKIFALKENAVYVYSVTGQLLGQLLSRSEGIESAIKLTIDTTEKRLYVCHSDGHITSVTYLLTTV